MKMLVIEDDIFKRDQITNFLKKNFIDYVTFEYLNPALEYIYIKKERILGIILDLGLQISKNSSETYSLYQGLNVIYEINRMNLKIPVLINSSTFVGMLDEYPFVYAQRTDVENYQLLKDFINFLKQRKKQ